MVAHGSPMGFWYWLTNLPSLGSLISTPVGTQRCPMGHGSPMGLQHGACVVCRSPMGRPWISHGFIVLVHGVTRELILLQWHVGRPSMHGFKMLAHVS